MDTSGSETAFNEVHGDAFVPACTLGVGQRAHMFFGQDINHLKFFTTYGLQEGYEPFCVYVHASYISIMNNLCLSQLYEIERNVNTVCIYTSCRPYYW